MTETKSKNKYDLEERTSKFGENTILFCRKIRQDTITKPLISQLVRSATSVGANYVEANGASSKKDFKNKIHICKKEAQESKHWFNMLAIAYPESINDAERLQKETQELILIFGKIISTLRN
ncbi:MAG TPA: four helix bundle protein [Candidatus Moranbacteria bacterium]|nr:four helix bundle protein [Candidatus Moranbacteria bacterium]